jgi:hypothetical protein
MSGKIEKPTIDLDGKAITDVNLMTKILEMMKDRILDLEKRVDELEKK